MPYSLSRATLDKYVSIFNRLDKHKIQYEVLMDHDYDASVGSYVAKFTPSINNISTIAELSAVWIAFGKIVGFPSRKIQITNVNLNRQLEHMGAARVTAELYKANNPSVKFFAEASLDAPAASKPGIYLISADPVERKIDEHTYRLVTSNEGPYQAHIVYCAPETDEHYNYIDKGHVVISTSTSEMEGSMFITDSITLDVNYVIAAFMCNSDCLKGLLRDNVFLPSKTARELLIRAERALKGPAAEKYRLLKASIQAEFAENTSNIMIAKLTRKECKAIELNNIKITAEKAVYAAGHVSIEGEDLAKTVFQSLNPNEEWDIFTLIELYCTWVENKFKLLPLNAEGTGFQEAQEFEFKINGIPLKVECFADNTRRAVNGKLINVDELAKVIRRAACYLPEDGYDHVGAFNQFVSDVSRISLRARDILSNGLPVKTLFLNADYHAGGKDATGKHPKLRFTRKDKRGFFLVINYLDKEGKVTKTEERRIGKFIEFVNKVQHINRHTYFSRYDNDGGGWTQTHEGGWERKDGTPNACAAKIVALLDTYAEGLADADKTELIGSVNRELSEAEKRSEELLAEAIKTTGAVKGEKGGKPGYIIKGQLRNYFVEEDALRVYNHDTGEYICVVNGNGDQGVGRDSLVTRLFALANDHMITKQVGTLHK